MSAKPSPDAANRPDLEPPLTELTAWLEDFVPRRWLRNGHLQTLAGNFLPRRYALPEPESMLVEVEPARADRPACYIVCHCHWQPQAVRRERLTVVLVHGLEGSSSSQYVLGNSARAWAAGLNVVRMNMRSCAGDERLSPSIYHSGLSQDVGSVVEEIVSAQQLRSVALIGYSMGGNLVLKWIGELGTRIPAEVKAAVGVSPLMDLTVSSAALHEPINRGYEWHFLRSMLGRMRRKVQLFPQIYSTEGLERIRSMRDFDGHIVARYGGFADADDYYQRAASSQFADRIAIPTLILHSLDDPFIRMLPSTRETLAANPHIRYIETKHGGHCAFLSPQAGNDSYWAEKTLLGFLLSTGGAE
jgi:predicted alpha/beta-fold hydrolase